MGGGVTRIDAHWHYFIAIEKLYNITHSANIPGVNDTSNYQGNNKNNSNTKDFDNRSYNLYVK